MIKIYSSARPHWSELYAAAWAMAESNLEIPAQKGWKTQMSCMPGSGKIWQWDSCFMAIYAKYSNGRIEAMNNLDNLYNMQAPDGYISMTYIIEEEREAYGRRINPPLFAYVEWKHYLYTNDRARLERVYAPLVKYFDWIDANRRRGDGTYFFEDPGSTGMDNSPRGAFQAHDLAGSDICYVDLLCQQALSAGYLSRIAAAIGEHQDAARFDHRVAELRQLLNAHHWSDNSGFFHDSFVRGGYYIDKNLHHCRIANQTIAGFWPLLAGLASPRQAESLVRHLSDPAKFNTPYPVPSVSADDPNYDPQGLYWLGGVWPPTNYMVIEGLKRYQYRALAREIAIRHIEQIHQVWAQDPQHTIWEAYSPQFARPSTNEDCVPVRPNFVGWGALGPIAMWIETVFGVEVDAPHNTIAWHPDADGGVQSLEGLRLGETGVDLAFDGQRTLQVTSSAAFSLQLHHNGKSMEFQINSGTDTFRL